MRFTTAPRVAAILLLLITPVTLAGAQGLTLPTARAVGPSSAAVKRLLELVNESAAWYPSGSPRSELMSVVRYRLLLAPFTKHQLGRLACVGNRLTMDDIWAEMYAKDISHGDPALAIALKRAVGNMSERDAASDAIYLGLAVRGLPEPRQNAKDLESYIEDARTQKAEASAVSIEPARVTAGIGAVTAHASEPCVAAKNVIEVTEAETGTLVELLSEKGGDGRLNGLLDSLGRTARQVVLERKVTHRLFPVRTTEQAAVFWKQQGWSPLNVASVAAGKQSAAAFTELASPFLNGIRLSFSSVVAAASEPDQRRTGDAADETSASNPVTISQFLNGGGQANLGASWPFLATHWASGDVVSVFFLSPRFGGTLSTLGTMQEDASAFIDPAVEWHGSWLDGSQGTGLLLQLRGGYASGGKSFREAVGVEHAFRYGSFAGGLMFGGRYVLNVARVLGGPSPLQQAQWQVGVTTLRGPQLTR